jgi:hypothetical protein
MREARPSSPGTPPGCRMTDDPQKESRGSQAWWTARTRSLAREVHSRLHLFANAAIVASRLACSSIFRFEFQSAGRSFKSCSCIMGASLSKYFSTSAMFCLN